MAKTSNGKLLGGIAIVAILALVAVIGLQSFSLGGAAPGTPAAQEQTQQLVQAVSGETICANNPDVDLELRLIDTNGASVAYRNGTVLVAQSDASGAQSIRVVDATSITSAVSDLTNALSCGKPAKGYVQHNVNGTNSVTPFELSAEQTRADPVKLDIKGASSFSTLQVRVFSNDLNDYLVANVSNAAATADQTIAPGQILNYTNINANATGITVGASGTYSVIVEAKTIEADKVFGAPYGFLVPVDMSNDNNNDDWDESRFAARALSAGLGTCSDVTSNWDANDRTALNTFEVLYHCTGTIGDTTREKFQLDFVAGQGVNPDFNMGMDFVQLGDFLNQENPNEVLSGVAFRNDGSTRTRLSPVQRLGFVIV